MWGGLFTLACALRRRVFLPKDSGLGSWDCYPHLYMFLVAPPGMRKTTTLNYGAELLEDIPNVIAAPTVSSTAVLAKHLSESPDSSLFIIAEEFGEFMSKSGNEMYEFLTGAFDAKKKLNIETISRGIEFSEKPCVNLGAGTTPNWIAANMPEAMIGAGFASRVIFVYEDSLRRRVLFHTDVNYPELEEKKKDLIHDLTHIANLAGTFTITPDAQEFIEVWYREQRPERKSPKLQGYFQRKHVHALKVAMLWHISYSDELIITRHDVEMALALLEMTEAKLDKVFAGVGKNKFAVDIKDIYNYIKENGPVSRSEILSQFESVANNDILLKLLEHLLSTNKIIVAAAQYSAKVVEP